MRVILNRLFSATNLPLRRYAVRFSSSDGQPAEKEQKEKDSEKIEVVKKSKV